MGLHEEEKISIIRDIFGLPDILNTGLNYYEPDLVKDEMTEEYKKVIDEVIEIKYINNESGNKIIIFLPKKQNSVTYNQIETIKYLGNKLKELQENKNTEIDIYVTDGNTYKEEKNSISKEIIPYLEKHLDDSYQMSIEDKNIIAEEEINKIVKK